jgi:hypothetical protein
MQAQSYQIAEKTDSRKIAEFLSKDGQLLLPFLELICNTEQAVDELIDVAGKAAIEAILLLSAQQIAGHKQPGKAKGRITAWRFAGWLRRCWIWRSDSSGLWVISSCGCWRRN